MANCKNCGAPVTWAFTHHGLRPVTLVTEGDDRFPLLWLCQIDSQPRSKGGAPPEAHLVPPGAPTDDLLLCVLHLLVCPNDPYAC